MYVSIYLSICLSDYLSIHLPLIYLCDRLHPAEVIERTVDHLSHGGLRLQDGLLHGYKVGLVVSPYTCVPVMMTSATDDVGVTRLRIERRSPRHLFF